MQWGTWFFDESYLSYGVLEKIMIFEPQGADFKRFFYLTYVKRWQVEHCSYLRAIEHDGTRQNDVGILRPRKTPTMLGFKSYFHDLSVNDKREI